MAYKWIAQEIERLDPEVDYERIFALSTVYYLNDFDMNVLYTLGFAHFILPPWGGETVARGGKGKIVGQKQKRANDTLRHFWTWFEYGPSHPHTMESLRQVNRIHQAIARAMPGNYSYDDDFIYTMCWLGCDFHRLRLRIGLPGFTDNQKVASNRFWHAIATQFWTENQMGVTFPDSFEDMLAFMDRYESVPWAHSPEGAMACDALIDQFENKWFPKPLKRLGRTMIYALLDWPARRVHHTPATHPVVRKAVELGMAAEFFLKERVLPDPTLSTPEKRRRMLARKPGFSAPQHTPDPDLAAAS